MAMALWHAANVNIKQAMLQLISAHAHSNVLDNNARNKLLQPEHDQHWAS